MEADPAVRTMGFRQMVAAQAALLGALVPDARGIALDAAAERFYRDSLEIIARNRALLEGLATRYRLGVVSNFTGNLDRCLAELDLLRLFSVTADSLLVGFAKPDARLFLHALAAIETAGGAPGGDNSRPTSGLPPRSGCHLLARAAESCRPCRGRGHGGSRGSPTCRRFWPDMHSLILAGGERQPARRQWDRRAQGARADWRVPQLLRLARARARGRGAITCLVCRGVSLEPVALELARLRAGPCTSAHPSSLHTLGLALPSSCPAMFLHDGRHGDAADDWPHVATKTQALLRPGPSRRSWSPCGRRAAAVRRPRRWAE
jgi:hypothetical protein